MSKKQELINAVGAVAEMAWIFLHGYKRRRR